MTTVVVLSVTKSLVVIQYIWNNESYTLATVNSKKLNTY